MFVEDGDPSQNFKAAKTALPKIGTRQFSIPTHSTEFNPAGNASNLVNKK